MDGEGVRWVDFVELSLSTQPTKLLSSEIMVKDTERFMEAAV